MIAISKLSYVASFLHPNCAAIRSENRALQLLCRGPWNAIPPNLLKSIKSIGMPAQATDLLSLSIASRVRVAHVTSQTVFARNLEIDNVFNGFDIVLKYLDLKLCNSTCIKSVCHAYSDFIAGNSLEDCGDIMQHEIYKQVVRQGTAFCFRSFISLKATRLLGTAPSEVQISNMISKYRFASGKSFALTFTHIRSISNHWCTRSRFGAQSQGCLFSCGHDTDSIKHTCICSSYWSAFFRVARIPIISINIEKVIVFSHNSTPICHSEFRSILIGLHICFLCFNSCRHGQKFSDRMVQHHLSHYMRRHTKASALLRDLQLHTSTSSTMPT